MYHVRQTFLYIYIHVYIHMLNKVSAVKKGRSVNEREKNQITL